MRPHARAVILLGGWLLMLPPVEVDHEGKRTAAIGAEPVTEWIQAAAFDTAEQCERERARLQQKAAEATKVQSKSAQMKGAREASKISGYLARCRRGSSRRH